MDNLFTPDLKFYAFRSLPDDERGECYEGPFGKEEHGYYIRNVETGDTIFYETETGGGEFEIVCWAKVDGLKQYIDW